MPSHYEFSYTLTEQEIYDGLKKSGIYKTSGKRAVIESVILGVFFLFFVWAFLYKRKFFEGVMAVVTLGVLLAVTFVPRHDMKKQAKTGRKDIKLRLYHDQLYIDAGETSNAVALDGTTEIKLLEKEKLLVLLLQGGGLLIIPLRGIPKEYRGQVTSQLLQTTA